MSGLRSALIVLTVFLVIGLTGTAMFKAFTQANEPDEIACQPMADNPKRIFLPAGAKAANFKLTSAEGHVVELKKMLKDKPVLVEFFATWCPHCQHSAPVLNELHQQFGDDVQFLAVNSGDRPNEPSTSEEYQREHHIEYPVLNRPSDETMDHYCIQGFPTFALVDKTGKVTWSQAGSLKDGLLNDLLSEFKQLGIDTSEYKAADAAEAVEAPEAVH